MLSQGTLLKRYKRFLADVETQSGEIITIHCPNTGAMTGCAEPGFDVFYSTSDNPKRKYPNTFELARNQYGHFIGVNTAKANQIVKDAIEQKKIPSLMGYARLQTEVKYGEENSRIDIFLSEGKEPDCFIEVKSTTLLINPETGLGAFPDAVTSRGQKHLRELASMVAIGKRAVLVFLVQHSGIKKVTVADHIDPAYGEEMKKALSAGVEIVVLRTHIDAQRIFATELAEFCYN